MRRTRRSGGFFLCLLLNLLLNWEALWIGGLIVWMLVIGWASDCGSRRDEPRENKNPYSAKQYPNSGSAADKKTE